MNYYIVRNIEEWAKKAHRNAIQPAIGSITCCAGNFLPISEIFYSKNKKKIRKNRLKTYKNKRKTARKLIETQMKALIAPTVILPKKEIKKLKNSWGKLFEKYPWLNNKWNFKISQPNASSRKISTAPTNSGKILTKESSLPSRLSLNPKKNNEPLKIKRIRPNC